MTIYSDIVEIMYIFMIVVKNQRKKKSVKNNCIVKNIL